MTIAFLFVVLFGLLFLNVPIAFALGIASLRIGDDLWILDSLFPKG